jgi:hypothetical protein
MWYEIKRSTLEESHASIKVAKRAGRWTVAILSFLLVNYALFIVLMILYGVLQTWVAVLCKDILALLVDSTAVVLILVSGIRLI